MCYFTKKCNQTEGKNKQIKRSRNSLEEEWKLFTKANVVNAV